ncbi:hypothetical protein JL721_10134 [Aureococcus anophagefferens]|nr:hypothetical protein JL721_10134 [Aureococcus anophagefferens]
MGRGGGGPDRTTKSALHAIARAESLSVHEIPFDDVPPELLCSGKLDFRVWSMIVSDKTAQRIGAEAKAREQRFVEKAMADMPEAYEAQQRKAEADARKAALERAHVETGLKDCLLGGATKLTDAGVAAVAVAAPALVSLDLSGALRVTDVSLRVVAANCLELRKLDAGGCAGLAGAGLAAVGAQCRKLEHVRLAGCAAATGWALAALVTGCGASLTHLDVSHCALLTDADCGAVAKHCPNLIRLDLSHCRQTGDQAAVNIAEKCHRLEYINMARSELLHKTSDAALLSIAGLRKTLVELDLNGCEMVTDVSNRALNALAKGCSTLVELGLAGCPRLTANGVGALCHASRETLEKVNLGCCGDCVDDDLVSALARGSPNLKQLFLRDCERWGQHLRNLRALARAVLVLQKHRRGYLGRRRFARLKAEFVRRWNASTTIEAFGRGCAGRARVKRIRTLIAFRLATAAATRIQAAYRAVVARRYVRILQHHALLRKERRLKGCGTIQRIYRGFLGRKRFQHFVDLDNAMIALRNRSRCERAKKEVAAVRAALKLRKQREHAMAVMLQARVRIIHTKNLVRKRKRARDAKKKVALCLQACYRAKRDSIIVYIAAAERQNKIEQAAAAVIQRAPLKVAREMRRAKALKRAKEKREWDASIVIQSGGGLRLPRASRS